jgi:ATP-binding cassette, subfamily B, bacterial MsbA
MPTSTPTLTQRFARLAPYLRSGRRGLVAAGLAALVGALTEPMVPALLQPLLDDGFSAGRLPLWLVPLAIIGLFAVRGMAGFVAQYGLAWTANRAVLELRRAMFERLLTARPALFTQHTSSSLTNTLVYEVQSGTGLLVASLLTLIKDSLVLIALLAYLMWLNWQLTMFVAVLFPVVAYVMRTLGKRLHRLTVQGQAATDQLAYVVEENVLAWRIVRLHAAAKRQTQRFIEQADQLRRLMIKSVAAGATMTPITQVLAACALSAVIVVALWQSGDKGGTVGSFVAFITAMLMLVAPIKHLSDVMAPITRGLASVERGLDLIEQSPAETGGSHEVARARGDIRLQAVSLRYGDNAVAALTDIDLTVRAGESVALVGPSGAGKSTLVNLLPRFIDASSGELALDGVPLADWNVRSLRRQFALVSQDVVLFNDSVAANVALGDETPRERIRDALRAAHLLEFVEAMPQGMDTLVGHNGSQLSGGQRQRLAIARAICKDAPILILDEATSALDSESERAVQMALDTLMQGRTTLVIAHRLSTIERVDRVVVLDGGRIVEQGSHAQLLAAGGLYARLHAMQFKGA